jgi:hypothetical protein
MKSHVEAAITGFVSQGLREMRFPDIRWTLDRPTVEVTDSMSICRRAISVRAGERRSADGGPMRYGYAINYGSESKIGGVQRHGGPIFGATANAHVNRRLGGCSFAPAASAGARRVRWCSLRLGGATLVLQEYRPGGRPEGSLGQGVIVCVV